MQRVSFYNSIVKFVSAVFFVKTIIASSPNYRAFSPHDQYDYEYGYINLKAYPEKKLDMKPFNITTTATRKDCAYNCFTSTERQCQSINIKEIHPDEEYECQLMDFDKHKCYPHFIDASEYTYYDIDTKCSEPMPCPSKNHWCIPDHVTGTYSCKCKHDYEGKYCDKKRETTFSFKIKADGEQPNVKKIVPGKSLYYAFSFWYYFDAAEERTNRLLINFGFPPSLCNLVRIQTNYKPRLTTGGDKKPVSTFPLRTWNNIALNIDLESQKVTIYINGVRDETVNKAFRSINNFNDALQNITEAWVILGNGLAIGGCDNANSVYKASFKEFYAWDRLLDENDFPLIHNKTFIPHNPFITWNDFKDDDERHTWNVDFNENVEL